MSSNDQAAIEKIAAHNGLTDMELFEQMVHGQDDIENSVCMSCGELARMEPDQDNGYCECCHSNDVKSALVLAGLI